MIRELSYAFRAVLVFTVLLGLGYPLVMTGLAQVLFKHKANGSLITSSNGTIIGSKLIGQNFTTPGYFYPRPSAAGAGGYDAQNSSGANLGPTNKKLIDVAKANLEKVLKENPGVKPEEVPLDAITNSASGLDPHISPAYAYLQATRVANARSMAVTDVNSLVDRFTEKRDIGFLGEQRVNVLLLNLELDRLSTKK